MHTSAPPRVDQALDRESLVSKHLRRLLESTRVVPWVADAGTWNFTYVGAQVAELLGYPRERWYEKDFWISHLHPDDREHAVAFCLKSAQKYREYEFDYRMIAATGRMVWLHDIVEVETRGGVIVELRGFLIDITARKEAEAELRSVASCLLTVREDEHRRLAQELHDGFNQRLAALSIRLGSVRQWDSTAPDVRRELVVAQDELVEITRDLQRVAHALHPATLEHLGLVATLQRHCHEVSQQEGLTVRFSADGDEKAISSGVSLCLYRIVQEALHNVVQHAKADDAEVILTSSSDGVTLTVRDRGVGFVTDRAEGRGLGLLGFRERVRPFGGILSIQSERGTGTELRVHIPLGTRANIGKD